MNADELRAQLNQEAIEFENAEFERNRLSKARLSEVEIKLGECKHQVEGSLSELSRRLESVEEVQQLIHAIYESTNATKSELSNLSLSFAAHAAKQAAIEKGFPDGDPDGHRRHHEALIRKALARAVFWEKMVTELSKYGILGVIGFIATAIWLAIKAEAHK